MRDIVVQAGLQSWHILPAQPHYVRISQIVRGMTCRRWCPRLLWFYDDLSSESCSRFSSMSFSDLFTVTNFSFMWRTLALSSSSLNEFSAPSRMPLTSSKFWFPKPSAFTVCSVVLSFLASSWFKLTDFRSVAWFETCWSSIRIFSFRCKGCCRVCCRQGQYFESYRQQSFHWLTVCCLDNSLPCQDSESCHWHHYHVQ